MIYQGMELQPVPSFAELVRDTLNSKDAKTEEQFWGDSLKDCERAIIPSCQPKVTPEEDQKQAFCMASGSRVKVADLEAICSRLRISPHHVIMLAFSRAVALATKTQSPLFGFFQLGRSLAFDNIERVSGPCVNMLPLGITHALQRAPLEAIRDIQQMLGSRVAYEQSKLVDAVRAFDPTAAQLPFNAHVNLLWNKTSLSGPMSDDDLFQPLPIGVPTDFSAAKSLAGRTAVDELDTSFLPRDNLFVDIGPGDEGILFGVRCDAGLMDEEGIRRFVGQIESQVLACMETLNV